MANIIIPLVDLDDLASSPKDVSSQPAENLQAISLECADALRKYGIMYLRNHGIPQELISKTFSSYTEFFKLPKSTKTLYSSTIVEDHRQKGGYYTCEGKGVKHRPPSFMESFRISDTELMNWSSDLQGMKDISEDIQAAFVGLARRVYQLLSIGLKQPVDTLTKIHSNMENITAANYYPALTQEDFEDGQMRLLSHTDVTTLTLLIPDSGGLEAKLVGNDTHTQVPFIPDTVLVLVGDALQRLTNDQFVAVEHRVIIPASSAGRKKIRQSLACFLWPDMDALIPEVQTSEKYPPKKYIDIFNDYMSTIYPDLK